MKKVKSIIYDIGGFDESKENNNVLEVLYYTKEEEQELALKEQKALQRAELLEKLGITEEEAKLLLS